MKRITWRVGDGTVHEIPEEAVVTFHADKGSELKVGIATYGDNNESTVIQVERSEAFRILCRNEGALNPPEEPKA